MERWAGEWQAACEHGACAACLYNWIEWQVPRCAAEGLLRIDCPGRGCHKTMPQKLVLATSRSAAALAVGIDDETHPKISDLCPVCITPTPFVDTRLWGNAHGPGCQDACATCLKTWIGANLDDCRRNRKLVTVPCLGADCDKALPQRLVFSLSSEAATLDRFVRRVMRLKSNSLYPAACQVYCPREECLGIGYLGSETIMCFFCEEQWDAPVATERTASLDDDDSSYGGVLLGGGVKRCPNPNCAVPIEKNGGCDHMTCARCGHQWWWSTLKPFQVNV